MSASAAIRLEKAKAHGAHYTPSELARFLVRATLERANLGASCAILDPACGDGSLLLAAAQVISHKRLRLVGIDRDSEALDVARDRLAGAVVADLHHGDFLTEYGSGVSVQNSLFTSDVAHPIGQGSFDLIIANPPYVRTQVMGAVAAQRLAAKFNLSGRIDLYHAFVSAMTEALREGGTLGLLCSNRFLSTESGAALRSLLWSAYELQWIIDLGDTKLFSAAVLPAIVIATKKRHSTQPKCDFSCAYEVQSGPETAKALDQPSILEAIQRRSEGVVRSSNTYYAIEHGKLSPSQSRDMPWVLSSEVRERWFSIVSKHTAFHFGDKVRIRVGIKTTADNVFIRDDWNDLPREIQPEPELLKELLTHHSADKWRPKAVATTKQVLYPHLAVDGRKSVINLSDFPRAKAYLERHHSQLAGRKYVLEAGRKWFEVWVPQQPEAWGTTKVVFPDISELPKFFLDFSGAVVNGDCYWFNFNDDDRDLPYLLLAVANSRFTVHYYDLVCANRLYSNRRRFITQYVARFPVPKPSEATRAAVELAKRLVHSRHQLPNLVELEEEIDQLVWKSFGLSKEAGRNGYL